jgi:hypothetical protein
VGLVVRVDLVDQTCSQWKVRNFAFLREVLRNMGAGYWCVWGQDKTRPGVTERRREMMKAQLRGCIKLRIYDTMAHTP